MNPRKSPLSVVVPLRCLRVLRASSVLNKISKFLWGKYGTLIILKVFAVRNKIKQLCMAPPSFNCICGNRAECSNIFRLHKVLVELFTKDLVPVLFSIILEDFLSWIKTFVNHQAQAVNTPDCSPWKLCDLQQLDICELLIHVCYNWLHAHNVTILRYLDDTVFYSRPGQIVDI